MSKQTIKQLIARHGSKHEKDISRGVRMCEEVWDFEREGRKGFRCFCLEQYVPPGRDRKQLLARLDEFHHSLFGALGGALKVVRAGQDMADRPSLAAEEVLGGFAPRSHLQADYRRFHISGLIQLNFGTEETRAPRSRSGWAGRRLGRIGREMIPAELSQQYAEASSEVDRFISAYNLHLDRFRYPDSAVSFPRGTQLICHWGLRDYMMSLNGARNGLPRQRAILDLMRRVVDGDVPAEVLDDPEVEWDIPGQRIRCPGESWKPVRRQGALRWSKFHKVWQAQRSIDPHTRHGNLIDQKFEEEREISEQKVVGMLTEILASPLAERIGRYIGDEVERDLEPFDIYYRDFETDGLGREVLNYRVEKRYPTAEALNEAITDILVQLGWVEERARWIRSRIRVDNARSAGHAWPPQHDHDLQLLRVRVGRGGCDEINFETFMHELGHCVEGVLSRYEMDYKILWGVPSTAFSEAFAFTFQDRTDQILGRSESGAAAPMMLKRFWEAFEISGPALTEIRFLHWLYDNPEATARQMMRAIRRIGDSLWDEFYARVFGENGHGLMSVYSHILWGDFYLAEYPIGYIIGHQVRQYLRGRSLAQEMETMCAQGDIFPESWMRSVLGEPISVRPLLEDTALALDQLGY